MSSKIDRGFISRRDTSNGGGWIRSLREANDVSRKVFGYALEDHVLEKTPLRDVDAFKLFTYMHRRFGLGNLPADPYNSLGAGWQITTPHPKVVLLVTPSFVGAGFSFMPYVICDSARGPIDWITPEIASEMASAYRRTLLDLLRPVRIGEDEINALGLVSSDNRPPAWTAPRTKAESETYPHHDAACGAAMPGTFFGTGDWFRLIGILADKGDGDVSTGIARAVAESEAAALEDFGYLEDRLTPIVAALLLWTAGTEASGIVERMGLEQQSIARRNELLSAMRDTWLTSPSKWIMTLEEADISRSAKIVRATGFACDVERCLKSVEIVQRFPEEYRKVSDLFDGRYDDDLVSFDQYPYERQIEEFRKRASDRGFSSVVGWLDALGDTDAGRRIRWMVVVTLWTSRRTRLKEEALA